MKKNNKGFSLVELIVVVLIMGIIAVALAPQVMKWVQKARDNGDKNTAKDLKSSFNSVIAEAISDNIKVPTTTTGFNIDKNTVEAGSNNVYGADGKFAALVKEVLAGDYPTPSKGGVFKVKITEVSSGSYKVEIVY